MKKPPSLSILLAAALVKACLSHIHHSHENFSVEAGSNEPDSPFYGCGTHDPNDYDIMLMNTHQDLWEYKQNLTAFTPLEEHERLLAKRQYNIPVFFHVLALSDRLGTMEDEELDRYIKRLNRVYRDTNFQFYLQGVQRRQGMKWHNCTIENQREWKSRLYIGGSDALNIYICRPFSLRNADQDVLGHSTWPTDATKKIDGVTVPHEYYYGRLETIYFLVHEIGHYLGLLHTFSNGCSSREREFEGMLISDGDGVQDTPAHAFPTQLAAGRPTCWQDVELDTCNDTLTDIDPGQDPVSNCK